VSRLSRKCGSLDVSQHYEPPPPVRGTALPFVTFIKNIYVQFVSSGFHFINNIALCLKRL
jgi:hypothetical protein